MTSKDLAERKVGNLTPLMILAPILFFVIRQNPNSTQLPEISRVRGKKLFATGLSCGIVTLVVALVMPQLPAAIIMFAAAWAAFLYGAFVLLKRW